MNLNFTKKHIKLICTPDTQILNLLSPELCGNYRLSSHRRKNATIFLRQFARVVTGPVVKAD